MPYAIVLSTAKRMYVSTMLTYDFLNFSSCIYIGTIKSSAFLKFSKHEKMSLIASTKFQSTHDGNLDQRMLVESRIFK